MFLASSSLKRHQYKCCSIAVRLPIPLLQAEGIEVIYPRLSVPRHLLPEVTRVTWNISDNAELFKPFRYGVRSPCGTDRRTDGQTATLIASPIMREPKHQILGTEASYDRH